MRVSLTIQGEPASKANSRQLVHFGKAPPWREALEEFIAGTLTVAQARSLLAMNDPRQSVIKSKKAREYEQAALRQIPTSARVMMAGPVRVTIKIFYASERPDLDESVVLDVLQARFKPGVDGDRVLIHPGVYRNDRQVREKIITHAIDKANPRAEIVVEEINAGLFDEPLPLPQRNHWPKPVASLTPGVDPF